MFDLPPQAGPARDNAILDHIRRGDYSVTWGIVTSEYNGHRAVFRVFADGLKIGGVRINVTANNAQQIADLLDSMLPTANLMDRMWLQRKYTLPIVDLQHPERNLVRPITSTTDAMADQSKKVDNAIRLQGGDPDRLDGIVMGQGKYWLIDNDILSSGKAMNYGFFNTSRASNYYGAPNEVNASAYKWPEDGQYMRLIQGRGTAHGPTHTDYSQILILVSKEAELDGKPVSLESILSNPETAGLAYHVPGVALRVLRQPGVAPPATALVTPPCVGDGCPTVVRWGEDSKPQGDDVKGTNWGLVGVGLGALALVVGGFFGGLALLKRKIR